MRIVYLSYPAFADCDFPLVEALRRAGHQVQYYLVVTPFHCHSTLVDIERLDPSYAIFPGSRYAELRKYDSYMDSSSISLVNFGGRSRWRMIQLWMKLYRAIKAFRPDVIQMTHFLPPYAYYYYPSFKGKLFMTIHDPVQHAGDELSWAERLRKAGMKWMSGFFMLSRNEAQTEAFMERYHVPAGKISYAALAPYETLSSIQGRGDICPSDFLFIGRITRYKGVDILVEAMEQVLASHPESRLVVAGAGDFWFDISRYRNDRVEIVNRFIGVEELVSRIRNTKYVVCPYREGTQSGVIMSALALATPVIATRTGNFAEVIKDGENGFMALPSDVKELASAMERALVPGVYERIRHNLLRDDARRSWDEIAAMYIGAYQQKLDK